MTRTLIVGSGFVGRALAARLTTAGESAGLARQRRAFRRIPSPPRCKLCAAPFAGIGGLVLRPAGYRRSLGNPALCTKCVTELRKQGMSGVEIPVTLLFSVKPIEVVVLRPAEVELGVGS